MQIKISFISDNNIVLPIHYNRILQGFIYNNIDKNLADFLHEKGYVINNRVFKLFTFSRILTKGKKEGSYLNFGNNIELMLASGVDNFSKSIVNTMIMSNELIIGKNLVKVNNIEMLDTKLEKTSLKVATLSGIVTYSTLTRPDGRKYTNYYQSGNRDFERIIKENLIKKYRLINKKEIENEDFSIKLLGKEMQNIVYYKETIIKGISGSFLLEGNKDLLEIGLNTGLGSRNSQGFGMVREIR